MFRICLLSLLFCFQSSTYSKVTPTPLRCPQSDMIKLEGIPYLERQTFGYVVYNISDYGLKEKWQFNIVDILSETENEAREKANKSLKTLSGVPSPKPNNSEGWDCEYHISGGLFLQAIASTPVY